MGGGETEHRRLERLLACVEREGSKRKTVYARWVASHRMLPEAAEWALKEWEEVRVFFAAAVTGQEGTDRDGLTRLICAVARECERRRRAYPNLVARGTLTPKTASREMLEMGEVATWLQERRAKG